MRRVLWILAVATVTVAIAWWVAFLPGRVTASAFGISVETVTPVAVVALALVVMTVYLVLRLFFGMFGVPEAWRFWRRSSRRRAGDAAVTRALVALAAGEAGSARRAAQHARATLGDTPQTLLLAAEAARLAGRSGDAEMIYLAMADKPDSAFIGLRGLFRQAVENEAWGDAAALARRAEALQPSGNWLKEARLRLADETGDWSRAIALAGPEVPVEVVATAAAAATADPDASARLARQAWKANPAFAPAVIAHAAALRRQGQEGRAEAVVVEAWRSSPHPDLADFLLDEGKDAAARLRIGTMLSNANAENIETQYLLARLSLEAGELREARFHAERAHGMTVPTRRIFVLLADLATADGGDPLPALRAAATADADPTWHCGHCGAAHAHWQAVCGSCHTPGRIGWSTSRAPRLLAAD